MKDKDVENLQKLLDIQRQMESKLLECKKIKLEIDALEIKAQEIAQEIKES